MIDLSASQSASRYVPSGHKAAENEPALPLDRLTHYPTMPPLRGLSRRHSMPTLRSPTDRPCPLDTHLVPAVSVNPDRIAEGSQQGINAGGCHVGRDGSRHYVKTSNDGHVRSELMNERIANQAGFPTMPGRRLADFPGGKLGLASPFRTDMKRIDEFPPRRQAAEFKEVRSSLAFFAATGNRDTPGMKLTNLMVIDGKQTLVDVGGAGAYGGRGGPKEGFGPVADEVRTMPTHAHLRNPEGKIVKIDGKPQQSATVDLGHGIRVHAPPLPTRPGEVVKTTKEAKIFSGTSTSEFEHGARKLAAVSDGQLAHAAIRHGFDLKLGRIYAARRDYVRDISNAN